MSEPGLFQIHEDTRAGILADPVLNAASGNRRILCRATDTSTWLFRSEDGVWHEWLDAAANHVHDAVSITSGVLDVARIPVMPSQVQVLSPGAIADLTIPLQAQIGQGTVVTTQGGPTNGFRWIYTGAGSKVFEASYIQLADITPEWIAIANKPALEPALGDPGAGSWFLRTVSGIRSWIQLGALAFLDTISNSNIAAGAAIAWEKISKTGAQASDVGALSTAGGTLTGSLMVGTPTGAARFVAVDGAATQTVGVALASAGNTRWILDRDSGATFELRAYNSDGVLIDVPLSVANIAGGNISLDRPLELKTLAGASFETSAAIDEAGNVRRGPLRIIGPQRCVLDAALEIIGSAAISNNGTTTAASYIASSFTIPFMGAGGFWAKLTSGTLKVLGALFTEVSNSRIWACDGGYGRLVLQRWSGTTDLIVTGTTSETDIFKGRDVGTIPNEYSVVEVLPDGEGDPFIPGDVLTPGREVRMTLVVQVTGTTGGNYSVRPKAGGGVLSYLTFSHPSSTDWFNIEFVGMVNAAGTRLNFKLTNSNSASSPINSMVSYITLTPGAGIELGCTVIPSAAGQIFTRMISTISA